MKYIKLFESFNLLASSFYDKYIDIFTNQWNSRNYTNEEFDNLINILERDCPKFLQELKSKKEYPLFRGSRDGVVVDSGIFIKDVDTNRKPKDTTISISDKFDSGFYNKFGINLRSKGTFATKLPNVAEGYGNIYMFFPIGEYEYFWNKDIEDLYTELFENSWYTDLVNALNNNLQSYHRLYRPDNGNGSWFLNDLDCGDDISYAILNAKNSDNRIKKMSNQQIKNLLVWEPDLSEEDYIKDLILKSEEYIKKCVSGYQKGGIENIRKQEITFICNKYYLVECGFYNKFIEYLNLKN